MVNIPWKPNQCADPEKKTHFVSRGGVGVVGSKPIFENLFHDVNVINLIFPGGTPSPLDPRMKPVLTNNQFNRNNNINKYWTLDI